MHISNKHFKKSVLPNILKYAAISFVLPFATAFGLPAPYLLSFCVTAPTCYAPVILLFSFVGLLCHGFSVLSAIDYANALMLIALRISCDRKKRNLSPLIYSFICAALIALCAAPTLLLADVDVVALALNRIFGIFVTCLACNCDAVSREKSSLCRIMPLALVLSSAVNIRLLGVNVGYVLTLLCLLHVAQFNDPIKSAYLNLFALIALGLPNLDFKIPVFVFATLTLVSLLTPTVPVRQPLYVTCLSVLFGALNVGSPDCVSFVTEIFVASVIFLVTLEPLRKILIPMVISLFPTVYVKFQPSIMSPFGNTLNILANQNILLPPQPIHSELVLNKICRNCDNYRECILTKHTDLSFLDTDFSAAAPACCLPDCSEKPNIERLLQRTDKRFDYLSARSEKAKTVLDTLMSISDAARHENGRKVNVNLSDEFNRRLTRVVGYDTHALIYDDLSCVFAVKSITKSCDAAALEILGLITCIRYRVTDHVNQYDLIYTYACPAPDYTASCCLRTVARDNKLPSGDVFDSLYVGNLAYFVLCDGMGTGLEAHNCAKTLLALFKESLLQGTDVLSALELAGTLMRLTSVDESFAAFDVLEVNLDNGKCVLYKAGGADSFVLADKFSVIPQGGFPVGVLDECDVVQFPIDVSLGGDILLCSDGAEVDAEKIEFALVHSDSPESLCNTLVGQCGDNLSHYDDRSVAVVSVNPKNSRKSL